METANAQESGVRSQESGAGDAAEEAKILADLAAIDNGTAPAQAPETPKSNDQKDQQQKPQDAPASQGNDGKPADEGSDEDRSQESGDKSQETDKTDKTGTGKSPEDAKKTGADAKPESAFVKAQKERKRLDDSWKKLQAEKEALRKEREALASEKANGQGANADGDKPRQEGPSAEAYEELAKRYEDEGNDAMAAKAREKAADVRAKAAAKASQKPAFEKPEDDPKFKEAWNKNVQELVQSVPELQAEQSPLRNVVTNLVSHEQYGKFLRAHPDGIKMAYEVALLMRDAAQVKSLNEKLAKAEAEVKRLTELTSLKGSHPAQGGGAPRRIEDMSDDEAEAEIKRQLGELDAAAT